MQYIHTAGYEPLAKGTRTWHTLTPRTLETLFSVKKDKVCDSTYMRDPGEARSETENTMVARRVWGREK